MVRVARTIALGLFAAAAALTTTAASARVDIRIHLGSQSMQVTSPDGQIHRWAISSGRAGYRTPTGVYSSKRLARMHYSSKYDDAPMPHSIFFHGGYAIHGTSSVRLLGRPASHGCIRLAPGNAARLFAMVQRHGARIAITGAASDGPVVANRRKARRIAVDMDADDAPRSLRRAPVAYDMQPPLRRSYAPGSYWILDGGGAGWRFR